MPLDELNNSPVCPADWPDFDRSLLGEDRPAAAAFPVEVLPERWRRWVGAASRSFGSADYLANGLIAAAAAVSGAGTWVGVTPHWHEPLLLWHALIGGASSGKSAAFARVRELLDAVKPWREEGDGGVGAKGGADGNEAVDDNPDLRGRLAARVDAKLGQLDLALFSSNVRGVLLWRSDLADWMDEAGGRTKRPAWLAGWSAEPAMIGGLSQHSFAVGILGALSPDRLAPGFLEGDSALAARFLYVWPPAPGLASLGGEEGDDKGIVAMLQKIADFAGHRETPGHVPLDEPARLRLEALMEALRRQADAADGVEAEWIAKGVSTIVRLAGLFALMAWAETPEDDPFDVEAAHIEAAHTLWSTYYRPQAQRVFDRGGVLGCERAARRVTRWLRRMRAPEISREDVRRQALCQTVTAEGAEDVLARLEMGGVLRSLQASGSAKGGPRRRRWAVHPELAHRRSGS